MMDQKFRKDEILCQSLERHLPRKRLISFFSSVQHSTDHNKTYDVVEKVVVNHRGE